jgi:hypothetical protein
MTRLRLRQVRVWLLSLVGVFPACQQATVKTGFPVASVRLTCRAAGRNVQCQVLALSRDVRQAPRDVTREAAWDLSGVEGARMSPTGIVEAARQGDVDVHVDYQSRTAHCLVRLTQHGPGQPLALVRGHVFVEDHASLQPEPGVRLEVVSGPDTGKSATTGGDGAFALGGLAPGTLDLRATKGGYRPTDLRLTVESGDVHTDVLMDAPTRRGLGRRSKGVCVALNSSSKGGINATQTPFDLRPRHSTDMALVGVRSSDDPSAD